MKKNTLLSNFFLILTALFIILPLVPVIIWSFTGRWPWPSMLPQSFSMRGIEEVIRDTKVIGVLISSILMSLLVASIATLTSLMAARAVSLYRFFGRKILMFGSMLPILIPSTVFAMGIHVFYIKWGLNDSFMGVVIAHVICALPYTVNILTGITSALGDALEEQAQVLGCNSPRSFLTVTLPLLMPGVLASMAMAFIISYSQYFVTLLLGGGVVKTFSLIMVPFISGGDRTLAGAYSLIFIVSALFVFILFEFIILAPLRKKLGQEAVSA